MWDSITAGQTAHFSRLENRRRAEIENRHPRSQVRRGPQPPVIGPFPRQRRPAGSAGDGSQPRPLDHAHRFGQAAGNHQDPPTTLLLSGRTPHPARHAVSPRIYPRAGPGKTSSSSGHGPIARSATPLLTPPSDFHLSTTPNARPVSAQAGSVTVSACDLGSKIASSPLPQAVKIPLAWPLHSGLSISPTSGHRQHFP